MRLCIRLGSNNWALILARNETLKISTLKEKPTVEEATAHLKVPGYDDNSFLTVFGYYVIPSIIFDHLQKQHDNNLRGNNGQFGFTDVLRSVMNVVGAKGLVMKGEIFILSWNKWWSSKK